VASSTACDWLEDGTYDPRSRQQTEQRTIAYKEAPRINCEGYGGKVTLEVRETVNTLNGVQLRHRSYNNQLVGPTICVQPGTQLRIRLENWLPPDDSSHPKDENTPHGFNTTNLHTHGLHVSPKSPSDNVFLALKPGNHFDFTFEIPADHPAGTFWYHPHKHGSTALQVASGMAGALIVEGGLDNAPGIKGITDRVLLFQQFVYFDDPQHPGRSFIDPVKLYNGEGDIHTAVNGQIVPTLNMRPGEIQRWRLIHGGVSEVINLTLPGLEMYEIAIDGLALGTLVPRDVIQLYPGYRSDVLVKAPTSPAVNVLSSEVRDSAESLRDRTIVQTDILKVSVQGPIRNMALPGVSELEPYAAFRDADVPTDSQLAFREVLAFANPGPKQFLINSVPFSSTTAAQQITVGTAGEWTLKSTGTHPFHVHVNPFAIWKADFEGPGKGRWVWRDTLILRRNSEQKVRSWFRRFDGQTVLHCHILDHEDQGMMQKIELAAIKRQAFQAAEGTPRDAANALKDPRRCPLLLVFHRGLSCDHCAEQLRLLGSRIADFQAMGIKLAGVSETLPEADELLATKRRLSICFDLWTDGKLDVFREFGCLGETDVPLHGIVLLDADGRILMQMSGEDPELDIDKLLTITRDRLSVAVDREAAIRQ
jgi:FtsP/CotA-like multicopper oxidase with cupredoxin domain/peroxiredoxin